MSRPEPDEAGAEPRSGLALAVAAVVATLAVGRVLWFAFADERPHLGFAEGSDLQRSIAYHLGVRRWLDWNWLGQVVRDGFKPPLWFGGIPLLASGSPALRLPHFLVTHAALLALALAGTYRSAAARAGPHGGVLAVLLLATSPGPATSAVSLGTEIVFVAAFSWLPFAFDAARAGRALPLALCICAAQLSKWTFVPYVLPTLLVSLFSAGRGTVLRACVFGGIPFVAWLLWAADLPLILAAAGAEPTYADPWSRQALTAIPRALLDQAGWPLVALMLLGVVSARGSVRVAAPGTPAAADPSGLQATLWPVLWVVALHTALPHKEPRYLAPLVPLLAVLAARAWVMPALGRGRPLLWAAPPIAFLGWPHQPPASDLHAPAALVAWPDPEDHGFADLASHPTFGAWDHAVLTFSIGPEQHFPLLAALQGELYLRGVRPLVPRYDHAHAWDPSCAYDLERSTHFVTNRDLDPDEVAALRTLDYTPVFEQHLQLAGFSERARTVAVWARVPRERGGGFTNP